MIDANTKVLDLTYTLSSDTPNWDGGCGFQLSLDVDYEDCKGPDKFRTQKILSRAGMGTHIDAPAHCFPGANTTEKLELDSLITKCAVIRVEQQVNQDYLAMPETVHKFEKDHGKIQPNTFVIFHTGWGSYWENPERYRNNLQFPSIHEATAQLLLERGISGIGTDTLSADAGGKSFPVHRAILGAGKYLVENIANTQQLPEAGARVFILPIKIRDATEAPLRLVAVLE